MQNYNTHLPGRIVEYFPDTQLATVRICNDGIYSTPEDDFLQDARPLLENVPVHTPGGGGWHMTFPVAVGDTCLLSFSQQGYDHWLYKDEDRAGERSDGYPNTWAFRKFDLTDGFCMVGYNTLPRKITDYQDDASELRNSDRTQRVSLNEDGSVLVKAGTATIKLTKDGDIEIDSDTAIKIGGNVFVTGGLFTSGDVLAGFGSTNVSLEGHKHTGSPSAPSGSVSNTGAPL